MGEIFIARRGRQAPVPSIFGNGSDGDAVISGIVTLPVPVPHRSIVEMQFKSLTINAGAILKAAAHNAGLTIRVQGDCVIHGTIDQSGLAPKTNTGNNFVYPSQLVCGDGGRGGGAINGYRDENGGTFTHSPGGAGMSKRSYGGGYSGGGRGGSALEHRHYSDGSSDQYRLGGAGGDATGITVDISSIFVGGEAKYLSNETGGTGAYGGGGGGSMTVKEIGYNSGTGGSGAGSWGSAGQGEPPKSGDYQYPGGGGGAGNYGGGVVLLYVGGNLIIDGKISCNGLDGGGGGTGTSGDQQYSISGASGGGAGGGAIYVLYRKIYTNTGSLQVNGGSSASGYIDSQYPPIAGGVGSITVVKYTS